jgi:hypothetical protein
MFLMRRRLPDNRANRQIMFLVASAMLPTAINHIIGWVFDVPITVTHIIQFNVLLMLALAATITVDRRLWGGAAFLFIAIVVSILRPQWVTLLFGAVTPVTLLYGLSKLRQRTLKDKRPPARPPNS